MNSHQSGFCITEHLYGMMATSYGNIFCFTGPLCGEFTGHRWIPLTKTCDTELWCFLWSAPKNRLNKQSRRRSFETPSHSLWRHCKVTRKNAYDIVVIVWSPDVQCHGYQRSHIGGTRWKIGSLLQYTNADKVVTAMAAGKNEFYYHNNASCAWK